MGWFTDLTLDILENTVGRAKYAYDDAKARREEEARRRKWEEEDRRREERRERERERREREAERRREQEAQEKAARLSTLKSDVESAARELSDYKRNIINPELTSQTLRATKAMRVSEADMNRDVNEKINRQIEHDEARETLDLKDELALINQLLHKIAMIERAN